MDGPYLKRQQVYDGSATSMCCPSPCHRVPLSDRGRAAEWNRERAEVTPGPAPQHGSSRGRQEPGQSSARPSCENLGLFYARYPVSLLLGLGGSSCQAEPCLSRNNNKNKGLIFLRQWGLSGLPRFVLAFT